MNNTALMLNKSIDGLIKGFLLIWLIKQLF